VQERFIFIKIMNSLLKTLFFMGMLSVAFSLSCKTYNCASISGNPTAKEWMCSEPEPGHEDKVVDFDDCTYDGEVCNTNVSTGSKAYCGVPTIKKLPGDVCSAATDCESGACTSNVCTGLAKGATCDMTAKICDAGFYCDPWHKCSETFKVGDNCAGYYFGCPFFSKCNVGADQSEKCVGLFSLANGSPVADTDSFLCTSGFAQGNPGAYTCQDGATLVGDRAVAEAAAPCKYSFGATQLSVCGFNTEDKAFCPFTSGDLTADEVTSLAKVANNNYTCSGLYFFKGKLGFECASLAAEKDAGIKSALEKLFYLQNDHHYAFVQSNPDCIKNSSIQDVNTFHQFIKGDGVHTTNGSNPNVAEVEFLA
jgi:hypothetical protein